MQLRPVPVSPGDASDDLLGRCWEVERACQRLVAPEEPIRGRAEKIGMLRYPPGRERRWIWTVGEVDGYASVTASEGSGTAWLTDLYVLPGRRRRGIGRALVEAAAEQTRAAGCKHLIGGFTDPAGPGFVAAVGGRVGTDRLRHSMLRLPLGAAPVRAVDGYRLVSWRGVTPDELIESYARSRHAINDAPHDDAIEPERFTPERIRDIEAALVRRDRDQFVTVALDGGGEVAGQTEVRVAREPGSGGFTEETAVRGEHRGRGLALWIKDHNIRWLSAQRPDVPYVKTDNDVTNTAMLAVNTRLGFVATSESAEAILDL
jgi:GNAT superfamily N-acetyltransferase